LASTKKKTSNRKTRALVGVIMGSKTDYETMKPAIELLTEFGVPFETKIVSAHRTPDHMFKYAASAESRGLKVIIAAAGGAAHLPGMVATKTILPVLGVPISSTELNGLDSLLSIAQMPKGIPVGTLAVGKPGAANAALLAAQILGLNDRALSARLKAWRNARTKDVLKQELR
jgi:5-(carboxyamino)imidazole ribonucleotide mutase